MNTFMAVTTYLAAAGLGYLAGFVSGVVEQNRRTKFVERIMQGSLNSPLPRNIRLGQIRRIGDDGEGLIKLDHPSDTENFEVGDYIRAMCGKHDRVAVAKIVSRDRSRALIGVSTMCHPRDKKIDPRTDTPYDWQPGDVLMPFDPVV